MIGSFGNIILEVNDNKKIIMNGFSSSEKARWTKHQINSIKARSEFLSDENKEYKFSLLLNAANNINPRKELEKIRNIKENGTVENFILGTEILGKFYIESFNVKYDYLDNQGGIWEMKIDINLYEYTNETYSTPDKIKNTTKRNKRATSLNYETGEIS